MKNILILLFITCSILSFGQRLRLQATAVTEATAAADTIADSGYYDNGQLKSEINFKDGKRDGISRAWYENGQLMYEGNYKDG